MMDDKNRKVYTRKIKTGRLADREKPEREESAKRKHKREAEESGAMNM